MSLLAQQTVTWVTVPPPALDLVGVVLGALGLAGLCAGVALVLGTAFGVATIVHRRRHPPPLRGDPGLHLLEAPRP